MISESVPRLIHCFGNEKNQINLEMVKKMILASRNNIIPINTHNIDGIEEWDLLPIGYGNANWRSLSKIMDLSEKIPVWNINLQTTAEEVIRRTLRVVDMGGKRAVKLEVLDDTHTCSNNKEVIKATEVLVNNYNLEIWPLIAPDKTTIDRLLELKCPMIRILGSGIATGNGVSKESIEMLKYIKGKNKKTKVMLDGGIGCSRDVYIALINGFDSVLVNSYLYTLEHTPDKELDKIVNVL